MDAYELNQITAAGPTMRTEPRASAASAAPYPWIQSPRFDLLFFILSPLISLPVLIYAPSGPSLVALWVGCILGVPHYLSTFTFFFWDETRATHRQRWMLFFGVPLIITGSIATAVLFRIPFLLQVVLYVWNTYHVSRQSCGILSIYRHRAGVRDPAVKGIVNGAVIWTSAALAFWNIQYYPSINRLMTLIWPSLPFAVWLITSSIAGVMLARLAVSMAQRFRSDNPPRMPELVFLGTSLLLFHPYLWIYDADRATLGMLLGHFLQYLGIVWLVHWRKFSDAPSSVPASAPGGAERPGAQRWLVTLSTNLPLLLVVLVSVGATFVVVRLASFQDPTLGRIYAGGFIALALVHFYLDGLFWAFRRPEVRGSLGPYLLGFARPSARP